MIAGAEVDARTYLLPDAVTWGGIASGILAASALNPFEPWLSAGAAVARALGTAVAVVLAMGLRPDQRSRRSRLWRCQARGGGRCLATACVDTVLLRTRDLPCFGDGHVRTPARWEHRCDSEVAVRCIFMPRPMAGLLCVPAVRLMIRSELHGSAGAEDAKSRGRSVEPVPVWPSPRAPIWVLPRWGAAARGVPARIITSGPTASDPTSSLPLPPAATPCLLDGAPSYSQVINSGVREGQRKRTIRQQASCTHSYKSNRSSEHYSPHSKSPSRDG
jgi:hypothetical protein